MKNLSTKVFLIRTLVSLMATVMVLVTFIVLGFSINIRDTNTGEDSIISIQFIAWDYPTMSKDSISLGSNVVADQENPASLVNVLSELSIIVFVISLIYFIYNFIALFITIYKPNWLKKEVDSIVNILVLILHIAFIIILTAGLMQIKYTVANNWEVNHDEVLVVDYGPEFFFAVAFSYIFPIFSLVIAFITNKYFKTDNY